MPDDLKEQILGTIGDLVMDFLDYARKGDEDLPEGVIEAAVESGTITIEEMVAQFETSLREELKGG